MHLKIKEMMEDKGYTHEELARRSGVTRPNITKYVNGNINLSEKSLKKILIQGFDFSPSQAERIILEDRMSVYEGMDAFHNERLATAELIAIPRLGYVACGPFSDHEKIGEDYFDASLIESGKKYFTMVADGISMQGKVDPGDVVLIEQTNQLFEGKIMLFQIREHSALGYLYREDDFIEIRKANRDFAPIKVTDPDFKIAGVVKAITKTNPH